MAKRQNHTVTAVVTYDIFAVDAIGARCAAIWLAHGNPSVLGETTTLADGKTTGACKSVDFGRVEEMRSLLRQCEQEIMTLQASVCSSLDFETRDNLTAMKVRKFLGDAG